MKYNVTMLALLITASILIGVIATQKAPPLPPVLSIFSTK